MSAHYCEGHHTTWNYSHLVCVFIHQPKANYWKENFRLILALMYPSLPVAR